MKPGWVISATLIAGTAALVAVVGASSAQPVVAAPPTGDSTVARPAPAALEGYIAPADMPNSVRLLGPPPSAGSGTKAGDLATYQATRGLEGTPRWALAARDAEFGPAPMMRDFSCAMGVKLDTESAPALYHLLGRVVVDAETIGRQAKNTFKRPRPFVENGGAICVNPEAWLAKSYSYPSGHSTFSWTAGLVLAEIAPDRAGEILSRARVYGESRVVCGVHYASDVQAGRLVAATVFSALQSHPAFQADIQRARSELARLRASGSAPDTAACRIEAEAAASPVW